MTPAIPAPAAPAAIPSAPPAASPVGTPEALAPAPAAPAAPPPPAASPEAPPAAFSSAEAGLWGKRLTRYEFARLVAARTQQLSDGAVTTLPDGAPPSMSPHLIAVRELEEGVIPLAVQREGADGKVETFRVDQLKIPAALLTHHKAMTLL